MSSYGKSIVCLMLTLGCIAVCAQENVSPPATAEETRTLGVVLYPGFEVLDVFGPVEMFMSVGASRLRVIMIAEKAGEVPSGSVGDKAGEWSGPKVVADYDFATAPRVDLLLVPGGAGTMQQLTNEAHKEFLRSRSGDAELVTSVCSGSAILAKAGLLDGRKATCNKQYFGMLTPNGPNVEWQKSARWVEDGKFITSSGVSAGTDMALAIIEKLFGSAVAERIANGTEYVWNRNPNDDPFAKL